ncbi:MAG: hypothetical protein G8D28_10165, partial [gamma proteobacterium symbiont of Phacoides pectinatus]
MNRATTCRCHRNSNPDSTRATTSEARAPRHQTMRQIILLNVSGQDHPGLTAALTEVLEE